MSHNDEFCPDFLKSPMVETVLGVQFDPIQGFRSNHYGWFWHEYLSKKGFTVVSDESLLPTYVEEFGVPKLNLTKKEVGEDFGGVRMKTRTEERGRTVQLQPDKLYLSWNHLNPEAPRYASVITEFMTLFDNLNEFATNASLGSVRPNLWEVQYINQIPPGQLWSDPKDWHRVFPTLFPSVAPSVTDLRFATYSGEWHFEIQPEKGRVHVRVAKMIMNKGTSPTLYFSLLARGEIGPSGTLDLVSGLEIGHAACMKLFFELTSSEAHREWELKS